MLSGLVALAPTAGAACAGSNGRVLEEAGSAGDPYRVGSAADLGAVGTGTCALTASYLQTADITMPAAVASGGVESNLTPIATASGAQFRGTYDGGGHRITGFVHADGRGLSAGPDVGLFARVGDGAVIRRVHLRDARVVGFVNIGTLVGLVEDGATGDPVLIEDVSATGSATAVESDVGGLVGKIFATAPTTLVEITGGDAGVAVTAQSAFGNAGGAIGRLRIEDRADLQITDVHTTGDVVVDALGGAGAGGLVGGVWMYGRTAPTSTTDVTITDSSAAGDVSIAAGGRVGGLIGDVTTQAKTRALRIQRSAASGAISGVDQAGGLIGYVSRWQADTADPADGIVEIVDAYATGAVVDTNDNDPAQAFGGIVGRLSDGGHAGGQLSLERVYATGAMPPGGDGIVGTYGFTTSIVASALWDRETTGVTASGLPGVADEGETTAQMRDRATFADAGWPIVPLWQAPAAGRTWGICASVNNGYPFLLMEYDAMPCAAPAAPTGLTAVAGDGRATVAFTAGAAGDAAITGYEASVDGGAWTALSGTASPLAVTGLVNGRSQSIRLRALSAVGAGAASEPVAVTPTAPASATGTLTRTRFTAMAGARVRVRATVTGPGRVVVTGTRAGATARAKARPLCTARATVKKAGTVTLFCALNRAARAQLARGPLRVRITAAYTPTGGTATTMAQVFTLPRAKRG